MSFTTEYHSSINGWVPTYPDLGHKNTFPALAEAQAEIAYLVKTNPPDRLRIRETTCTETIHPTPVPTFIIQRLWALGTPPHWDVTGNCQPTYPTLAAARAAYTEAAKKHPYMNDHKYRILETPGDIVHSPLVPTTFRVQYKDTGNTVDWGLTEPFSTLIEAREAWIKSRNRYGSSYYSTQYSILELPANITHPCYVAPPPPSYSVEHSYQGIWEPTRFTPTPHPTLAEALAAVAKHHDGIKAWWTKYRIRETVSGKITPIPAPTMTITATLSIPADQWESRDTNPWDGPFKASHKNGLFIAFNGTAFEEPLRIISVTAKEDPAKVV